jgi:trk system potassium uptake protein TrkA
MAPHRRRGCRREDNLKANVFILIVGGGKVGSYLTRALINQNHEVVVVEKVEKKAKMLEQLIDRQVTVVGDGCDPTVLEAAGVARADVVVADTGDDEDNLVVVLLTKKKSKARCIARVNNPRNKLIFDSLDPEDPVTVISSTEIILDVLNEQVNAASYSSALETMHLFGKGNLSLIRLTIPEHCSTDGKQLAEVALPRGSVVVAIEPQSGELVIPNGETVLRANDRVVAVVKNGAVEQFYSVFCSPVPAR